MAGTGTLDITVTPMAMRTEYKLSNAGHRFIGTVRSTTVIDTGWHPTPDGAAAHLGRLLGGLAADNAARYL